MMWECGVWEEWVRVKGRVKGGGLLGDEVGLAQNGPPKVRLDDDEATWSKSDLFSLSSLFSLWSGLAPPIVTSSQST